jgi:DNA polymerase-4
MGFLLRFVVEYTRIALLRRGCPVQAFFDALPVEKFFGVGKVTAATLRKHSILSGADLRQVSEEQLRELLGSRGSLPYQYVGAEDERSVEPVRERKSVGKEITLERDLADLGQMEAILANLAEQVERRLTDLELEARTLSLKVRWSDFQLITRSISPTRIKRTSGRCRTSFGLPLPGSGLASSAV